MKNKDLPYTIGIGLIIVGIIVAIAGLGGFGVSFLIRADLSARDVGISPLDFIANNFRSICAFQILAGILIAGLGKFLLRKPHNEKH